METRWMRGPEAATYCRYSDPKAFLKLAKGYRIKRDGPIGKHFDRHKLDQWMEDPHCFIREERQQREQAATHRKGGFTPIHNIRIHALNLAKERIQTE